METPKQPDSQEVATVETSLYNRMLRNAFVGFMKSAVIGAVIGLALGAIAASTGILPVVATSGSMGAIMEGALHVGTWFAGLAGSFGAVAGIQSTRDTRRWFLKHENPDLSPENTREQRVVLQPELTEKLQSADHFQKMVSDKMQDKSESPRIG